MDAFTIPPEKPRFERPSVWEAFAAWRECTMPGHQMKTYYVHGNVDPCRPQLDALKMALRLKFHREDKAKELYDSFRQTEPQKRGHTLGVVWEKREHPPEYWKREPEENAREFMAAYQDCTRR
eukprot:m.17056 g.17056  ORF g.17056 m.17056 type:complete len:123 (+) comp3204_c0_seq1:2-370(+)